MFLYLRVLLFYLLPVFFCAAGARALNLPDSIVIYDGASSHFKGYSYRYVLKPKGRQYILYRTGERKWDFDSDSLRTEHKRLGSLPVEELKAFLAAVEDTSFRYLHPRNFGYDAAWQEREAPRLLGYALKRRQYWSPELEARMLAGLKDPAAMQHAMNKVVGREGIYIISKHASYDFRVILYYRNRAAFSIEAGENPLGMPWILHGRLSYNPSLPRFFAALLPAADKSMNRRRFELEGELPRQLSEEICDNLKNELDSLSAVAVMNELADLAPVFRINGAREHGYFGRYISSPLQVYKVSLQNERMHPQLSLQYMVSRNDGRLYPRDSLLREWKSAVDRVQDIPFLREFLDGNSARRLDLYYFDNSGMNPYLKDGFNKNPEEWARYDKAPDPRFIGLYCGCNFRLPDAYLDEALFFELIDEENNASIWIVLPDNTPVLYHFSGPQVYRYSSADMGTNGGGVQYACKKFNPDGSIRN